MLKKSNFKVVSTAPYFFDDSGHYRAYHTALQNVFESNIVTYVPMRCTSQGLDSKWVRFFKDSQCRWICLLYRIAQYCVLIAKLARNREERSILFIESYTLLDLFALAIGITLFSKRRVELWHVIRDGLEWHPFKRRVHQMFSSLFGRYPYRLFTDSEKIVTSVGKTISLLPIPHICSFRSDQIGIRKERTRLWLPGKCRSDKGAKHVIQLAMSQELCLKRVDLLIEPSEALKGAVIRVIPTPSDLSRSEYEQTLASVDALLLPYDPVIYISRTSGPFVEAICAGKMVFTKAGNWLAYELEKHDLGECILNWEESDLGMQITSILNRQQTRQKFSSMRSTYLSFHNQENFKKILTSFI